MTLPPDYTAGTWNWEFMRKFATFWPEHLPAPPDFPWLAGLVTRKKAWRWASQFPKTFAEIEPSDIESITTFISATLTAVDPSVSGNGEKGDKGCCGSKPPPGPPFPPIGNLPDDGHCENTPDYYSCIGCPPGSGRKVGTFDNCYTVMLDFCTVTTDCPDVGPIVPDTF